MKPIFTRAELDVMTVLWEHDWLTPAQIEERFPRPIKNAALRSVLLILLEKGHVARRKVSRAYAYKAKTPQRKTFQQMIRGLSRMFCGGSPVALIAQLIATEKLSEDDIRELQRLIAQKADELNQRNEEKNHGRGGNSTVG